jgi:hypothetical protein
MTRDGIRVALKAVEAFRDRAKVVMAETAGEPRQDTNLFASRATASLRRASMELTRALAEMRRP